MKATEEEHLALLGLLNSSVWEFWGQQVSHNKGGPGGASSKDEKWHDFYERDGAKLSKSPIPPGMDALIPLARELDRLGRERSELEKGLSKVERISRATLREVAERRSEIYQRMVTLQEELDWKTYSLFGLVPKDVIWQSDIQDVPSIRPGERAFEIFLAREVHRGQVTTRWYEREERVFCTDLPASWPSAYKTLVQRRLEVISEDRLLRLAETPNCKRRWELEPFEAVQDAYLQQWLLKHIEDRLSKRGHELTTVSRLADLLRRDHDFLAGAELCTGRDDYDLTKLVADLVLSQDVPYLSALRHSPSGLRKRAQWEETWKLQRLEDAGENVDKIPVPPKYKSTDFLKSHYWSLRGKLDVPKERFVSYPLAEREADPTPVIGWAGWDHLEKAKALASYYLERKEQDGWDAERLTPLLAGLLELIPWLKQWHNDIDPDMDVRLGDFYEGFLNEQARSLGLTLQDLRDWRPPSRPDRRRRKGG